MFNTVFNNEERSYHTIKIESTLLNGYGLTSPTINQLVDWWYQTNYDGSYKNRIFSRNGEIIQNLSQFLNLDSEALFTTWRKEGYNGKYVQYSAKNLPSWNFYELGSTLFEYNDLNVDDANLSLPENQFVDSQFQQWIIKIIRMHESVLNTTFSDFEQYSDTLKARKLLSEDIVVGKGVSWFGSIELNGATENVAYTLKLFDILALTKTSNTIGHKNLIISKVPTDQIGRRIFSSSYGSWSVAKSQDDPREFNHGELSLTWNPVEKKYESGTIQIPAILTTDIEAANQRTSDTLESINIKEMLDNPTSDTYLNMPTGLAIVLFNVNGNPSLLTPSYKLPESERNLDLEKQKILVHNPFPRSFSKDQCVILSKINGVWIPIDSGQGKAATKKKKIKYPEKWEFSYFMTNPNHFYIRKDGTRFKYEDFEAAVRAAYYYFSGNYSQQENIIADKQKDLNISDHQDGVNYGHFQITSFDFMGPKLGGKNAANALANTHIEFDSKTLPYEKGGSDIRIAAVNTAPFFGCVFVDGYSDSKILSYNNKEHNKSSVQNQNNDNSPDYTISISNENSPFDNDNQNKIQEAGMFPTTSNGFFVDTTLSHLPADIALNASPNGVNGSPINVYNSTIFYIEGWVNQQKTIYDLKSRIWHSSDDTDLNSSFFDFNPANKNRIQFRPLKAEVLAFAEKNQSNSQMYIANSNAAYVRANRGIFGAEARNTQKGFASILYGEDYANLKNRFNLTKVGNTQIIDNAFYKNLFGDKGIKYNADFFEYQNRDSSIPPTVNPVYNNNTNADNFSPFIWGYKDWLLHPERGGGGIGVIGAQYTVSAESSIVFDTKSLLGQPPVKKMRQYNFNDPIFISPIGGGIGWGGGSYNPIVTDIDQMWGRCDFYYDLNTTGLFVRIFAAWPKEQTYYDPRYFSVFHFNPIDKDKKFNITRYWHKNGSKKPEYVVGGNPPSEEEQRSYPNGWYIVDEIETSVDVRVPTLRVVESNGFSENQIEGMVTYKKLREYKDWNIQTLRRGKLLPFLSTFKTVGIGNADSLECKNIQSAEEDDKFIDFDCIIYNVGQGYTNDDLFTVPDGQDVILKSTVNNGAITGFSIINSGKNLSSNFLANENDKIKTNGIPNSPSKLLKIIPLKLSANSSGKNFSGYITRAYIKDLVIRDEKPAEVVEAPVKLTPNPNGELDLTYEPSRITDISVLKTLEDGTVEPYSENDQYDLFFHFHNDISHTLIGRDTNLLGAAGRWGGNNAWENAVTLTLSSK